VARSPAFGRGARPGSAALAGVADRVARPGHRRGHRELDGGHRERRAAPGPERAARPAPGRAGLDGALAGRRRDPLLGGGAQPTGQHPAPGAAGKPSLPGLDPGDGLAGRPSARSGSTAWAASTTGWPVSTTPATSSATPRPPPSRPPRSGAGPRTRPTG